MSSPRLTSLRHDFELIGSTVTAVNVRYSVYTRAPHQTISAGPRAFCQLFSHVILAAELHRGGQKAHEPANGNHTQLVITQAGANESLLELPKTLKRTLAGHAGALEAAADAARA